MDSRAGFGTLFLFGLPFLLFSWMADFLLPWIGGIYNLTLISGKDRRLHAWQGNSDNNFQQNLEMLRNATGADVSRV